jgi:uncharacterized protein YbaP (TraB family)
MISSIKYFLPVVLAVLLALLCINCTAPETTEPTTATTAPVKTGEKEFVWEITSGSNTVYLMGSIHVADADTFPLPMAVGDAFDESDILVVEVNVNETDEAESLALIMEYGKYPSGETLEDNLPEELYERLADQFAEWGIGIGYFKMYRPWLVENILEVSTLQALGYTSEYGIDVYFLESAAARNMEIVELETEEFQIQLLANIPDDIMIKIIEINLDNPINIEDIEELFACWETGDAAAMETLVFEGLDDAPELIPFYQALYDDRNHTMMDKIVEFLEDDQTYFVVVGSGHLVGEEGLLNLLEDAGYSVNQLEG